MGQFKFSIDFEKACSLELLNSKPFAKLLISICLSFFLRILASDFETLQFIADFKTTPHDPTALYFVSSKFHRFFLKNLNTFEINTRILRIGNVAQSAPYSSYDPVYQAIPQFSQNNLAQYSVPNVAPTSPTFAFPYSAPTTAATYPTQPTGSAYPLAKPSYSLYSIEQQYLTAPAYYPSFSSPSAPPSTPVSYAYNPVTSFFKYRGSSPYAFDQLSLIDKRNTYPFQQLNAGESLPQSHSSNFNFGLAGEVYQPARFSRNATVVYH
jgi:Major royal jelly protein